MERNLRARDEALKAIESKSFPLLRPGTAWRFLPHSRPNFSQPYLFINEIDDSHPFPVRSCEKFIWEDLRYTKEWVLDNCEFWCDLEAFH